MRPERLYLRDTVDAADAIGRFLSARTNKSFAADELLRSAVLHKLTVIGEAAARLPERFTRRHPEVEWAEIVAFRNIAVHAYFSVDWDIVWNAATHDAVLLRRQAASILAGMDQPPSDDDPPQ